MSGKFDVVVIGAGPAGLQAAINAVRKKASVLVLGRPERSSLFKAHIENYLCVKGVNEGAELLALGIDQIKSFGAKYAAEDVLQLRVLRGRQIVDGHLTTVRAFSVNPIHQRGLGST